MKLLKNSKINFIILGAIIAVIISVIIVTIFFINSYTHIEVWERSNDNYLDETVSLEKGKCFKEVEESESTEYKRDDEQTEEGSETHNLIGETEELVENEISENVADNDEIKHEIEESAEKKEELCCTIEVRCDKILDNISKLDDEKKDLIPANGVILNKKEAVFKEGETVFDVLLRVLKESKIHLEFVKTPLNNNVYIEGINNIYEFDCGELSGWMYKVNDKFPNYGCGKYYLKKGDIVEFIYTCDLGRDIGGENISQK